MLHVRVYLYLLTQIILIAVAIEVKEPLHCSFIHTNAFDHCIKDSTIPSSINRIYAFNSSLKDQGEYSQCVGEGTCHKIFNVTRVHGQFFSERTLKKLSEMLRQCCGKCAKYFLGDLSTELRHAERSAIELSDIVYPVLGRASLYEMYNFHFIPVFEVPGAYLFTLEMSEKEMAQTIIRGCLNMWSLFVICVLWALVAGFFIWVCETSHNSEQFPQPFLNGLFEGFWWSFVSMTTVGYGDKIPKGFFGRMFSVIWILIGITITSIYIGGLAGTIFTIQSPARPTLNGRVIGGLKHQLQDATIVAQHGGILRAIDVDDEVIGVAELISQLHSKTLEGFVINKVTYQDFFQAVTGNEKYKDIAETVHKFPLIRTELDYKGEKLVIGMLVKSIDDYAYFKRYFENNWLQIQACNSFDLNSKDQEFDHGEASHFEGLFYPFFYGTLTVLGAIFCFGCTYEICRRKHHQHHAKENIELCEQ